MFMQAVNEVRDFPAWPGPLPVAGKCCLININDANGCGFVFARLGLLLGVEHSQACCLQ